MDFARLPVHWRPLDLPGRSSAEALSVSGRIDAVLTSWYATPYMPGNAERGVGVDCVRFLACVLDALYGQPTVAPERLPADTSLHSPMGARAALRRFLRAYEPNQEVEDGTIQPGDVLVLAAPGAGPGHGLVVSGQRNVLVHATREGVARSGILFPAGTTARVYRVQDKELWLR